ncbi:MAG TPA: hypothetical protein VF432_17675 [Thermoanaerobaculia bacterium]
MPFRKDVLSRKRTIARGEGDVHKAHYVLKNSGIAELPFAGG